MSSIASGSSVNLTSSVARTIAANESAAPLKTVESSQPASAGDSMRAAFAALMQAHRSAAGPGSAAPPGTIEPFVPPQLAAGGLISTIKEALGAFQEIAGFKQRSNVDVPIVFRDESGGGPTDPSASGLAQRKDAPGYLSEPDASGMAPHKDTSGAPSDPTASGMAPRKDLTAGDTDIQRIGDLDDAQRVGLEADIQLVGDLGGKQRVGLDSDKQKLLGFDKQRIDTGDAAAGADGQGGSPAVQVLDDANNLFRLLDQIVAGDKAIGLRPNQVLR